MPFQRQVQRFAQLTQRTVSQVIIDSFISTGSAVIDRTPVGNPDLWANPAPADYVPGTLKNSWFASVGAPVSLMPRSQNRQGRDSFQNLLAVAPTIVGQEAFFVNTTVYARRIEYGHSAIQAPAGMVRISAIEFPEMVRQRVRLAR